MSRDYPASQGGAAIGARLRRLSERIDRGADRLYAELNIDFQQRWFGTLNQLVLHGSLSVSEIADALGVTHAAVSQTRAALAERGLIEAQTDPNDARRRTLALSASGKKLVKRLAPVWAALNDVGRELDREAGRAVETLEKLEAALDRKGLAERVRDKL